MKGLIICQIITNWDVSQGISFFRRTQYNLNYGTFNMLNSSLLFSLYGFLSNPGIPVPN